ncbi:CMGC SRPK kinase [Fusarium agapanthi]|uniref:non-specific serine/threonine protein kinase n=1 Tax=Fusarium agapanthi TaxID=1803897 RepID=A0A9P5B4V7_9HYPO|nr:CMGC SRPK kinase [Fusarium agapanthi]
MDVVATKLGYGANSTVWLARDLNRWKWSAEKYVAIKVKAPMNSKRRASAENEIEILQHINRTNPKHHGWHFVRKLTDTFNLESPYGSHICLVLEPLREPLWLYCSRYIGGVIPPDTVKILLQMILLAHDYLHTECHVVHAGKWLNRHPVRSTPGKLHYGAIQGEKYRAPEVILNSGFSYSADIWSLGVMLWDLLENKSHFNPGTLGDGTGHGDLTHLAQITALLGHAPQDLLKKGRRSALIYQEHGELKDPSRIPSSFNLESTLTCMAGEERRQFVHFVKRMMTWRPEDRSTAKELLDDPWLYKDFPQD